MGRISPQLAGETALRVFTTPPRIPRPNWEKELLNSGQKILLANGLSAYRWGDLSSPIVLLVHGWMGRGTQLGMLIQPLLEKGFQVVALDGPAHGDSPGKRTAASFFANSILDVSNQLGGIHSIVAHSFGAGATAIALKRGLKLEKFVLVASPSDLVWVVDGYAREMRLTEAVERAFKKSLENWTGLSLKDADIAAIGKLVSLPVLIVHDPKDREVPFKDAIKIHENWSRSKLLSLEGVGHYRILKSKQFTLAVVDFLTNPN